MRIECQKHARWIELPNGAKRECPECPKRSELRRVVGLGVDRMMLLTPEQAATYDAGQEAGR